MGGTSWAEGFFTGGDTPPPVMPDLIGCPFPLPPSPLGLARGSGAMIPYFGGASREEKRNKCFLDPRVRKDDRRRGVAGGGFFHRWGPLLSLKSGIHVAWMLAFAHMTGRGRQA